jgi:hypothetical protein
MAQDKNWRKQEPSLKEVINLYPELPKTFITKVDVQRRGIIYTDEAKKLLNPQIHQIQLEGSQNLGMSIYTDSIPVGLTLKDGSTLMSGFDYDFEKAHRDPYVIDAFDGKAYLTDNDEIIEEVTYWEKPDFYNKKVSNGSSMSIYATARPQRLDITLNAYCHFWDTPGEGCKYCPLSPNFKRSGSKVEQQKLQYISETVKEALKEKGRFSSIMLSGGSILSGKELLDDELDGYINLLKVIGENFEENKRFPSQLIATAFNERQIERLYNETGLMNYTADIEVLDEEKFNWICAGKAVHIGYEEWKRRLYYAVDVFGKGNVNSGFVLGVELATPKGFKSEDESFKRITETAQELAEHGVGLSANIWRAASGSIFANQKTPTLEYFIRSLNEFDKISRKYKLGRYIDDYRRCGMHPGNDLLRI